MMGLLEGYCIPLYKWHYNPIGFDEKMDSMKLSFRLLQDVGLPQPIAKTEGKTVGRSQHNQREEQSNEKGYRVEATILDWYSYPRGIVIQCNAAVELILTLSIHTPYKETLL